ncbi:MAG: ZIP family metal transporter [Desulfurococcales archaeon]|nr:ZIP family metal transporter [Desulfurococcales archaeon]
MNPIIWLQRTLVEAAGSNMILLAAVLSGIAALLTTLGALPVFFIKKGSTHHVLDVGLGFSSGVMIVASFTSLLLPAMDMAGFWKPIAGFILGAISIAVLNRVIPHEHIIKGYEGPAALRNKAKAAWLVAMAIIIHNLPEGMAIGSSTVYSPALGVATGIAIALQDTPEGFAVALPIALITGRRSKGFLYGLLSGLSEMTVAVPTALLGSISYHLLPYLLGYGAGAMVYVVSHEALPESHRTGHERDATIGFFIGFLVMLYLDSTLG